MLHRTLGGTGLKASAVGLGAGPLGDFRIDDVTAVGVVHHALDLGITLIDNAPSYGASEARLAIALKHHRHQVVLATKGGYGVAGIPDWTAEVMTRGIEQALSRLQTDHLDIFLLHSCGLDVLQRGDLFEPLQRAKQQGRIRAIGYSGDGPALEWAVCSGLFDVVECSVNVVDQRALEAAIPQAVSRGVGVIAKRAFANAAWRPDADGSRNDVAQYRSRWNVMFDPQEAAVMDDEAVRFAAYAPGVTSALVGTRNRQHLSAVASSLEGGPLFEARTQDIAARFRRHGREWSGVV
jgi:aryl-alcohol dehydrogenase-like predicted oxidoreductase